MRYLVSTRRTIAATDGLATLSDRACLVKGRKSFQHFQAPPEKVAADQDAERHFHQLNN